MLRFGLWLSWSEEDDSEIVFKRSENRSRWFRSLTIQWKINVLYISQVRPDGSFSDLSFIFGGLLPAADLAGRGDDDGVVSERCCRSALACRSANVPENGVTPIPETMIKVWLKW